MEVVGGAATPGMKSCFFPLQGGVFDGSEAPGAIQLNQKSSYGVQPNQFLPQFTCRNEPWITPASK